MFVDIKGMQRIETEMVREIVEILKNANIPFYMCCGSVLGTIRHQGPIPWDSDVDLLIPYDRQKAMIEILRSNLSERFDVDHFDVNPKYPNTFPRVVLKHRSCGCGNYIHVDLFPLIGLPSDESERKEFADKLLALQKVMRKRLFKNSITRPNLLKNIYGSVVVLREYVKTFRPLKKLRDDYESLLAAYPYEQATFVMNGCGHYGLKNIFEKKVFGVPEWRAYGNIEVPIPQEWDFYLKRYYKDSYMQFPPQEERDKALNRRVAVGKEDYELIEGLLD